MGYARLGGRQKNECVYFQSNKVVLCFQCRCVLIRREIQRVNKINEEEEKMVEVGVWRRIRKVK